MGRRSRVSWWLVALVGLVSVAWFAWPDDEAVELSPPAPAPLMPAVAAAEPALDAIAPEPIVADEDGAVAFEPDSGAPFDAGVSAPSEPPPADVAAYIDRWRKALAPLLKFSSRRTMRPVIEGSPTSRKDACAPERALQIASREEPLDVLVAVDTSGSMVGRGLEPAAAFLGRLEYELVSRRRDARLLVLAAPEDVLLPPAAIATNTVISSNDGLDVVLETARTPPTRWLTRLREGVELRLVLITDDGPEASSTVEDFVSRLRQLVSDRPFSFSVLGGFGVIERQPVLTSGDAVRSTRPCRGPPPLNRIIGVDPGVVYQGVANATGGLRGSLCSEASIVGLAERLSTPRVSVAPCGGELGPDTRLLGAQARDPRGGGIYLLQEPIPMQCPGLRRSYFIDGSRLVLCPDTCRELMEMGVTHLDVRVECPPTEPGE